MTEFAGYCQAPGSRRVMAARVQAESAERVSGCVTERLRKQPHFRSLARRLPLRADASREMLGSDNITIG